VWGRGWNLTGPRTMVRTCARKSATLEQQMAKRAGLSGWRWSAAHRPSVSCLLARHRLLLHTVGARSGEPRTTMLAQFPEPDGSTVVVASFGGAARHSAWYVNLAKHTDQVWIERNRKLIRVRPESVTGDERERVWRRIVAIAPGVAEYQRKTDRQWPVVRLTPVD